MNACKKILALLLAAAALLSLGACAAQPGQQPEEKHYTDPNTAFDTYDNRAYNAYLLGDKAAIPNQWEGYGIGDPFVMRHNGVYYLYCSTLNHEIGIRGYRSADLITWEPITGEGLPEGYVSMDNVTDSAYAPEVFYFNGLFYMYTSPGGTGHYVLTASKPEGPFVKATDNFGMAIDGSVFIDDDESMYFTYADKGGIRMAKMIDMLTVDASSTPNLNNTSIGGWTEGPYLMKRDGIYYLTFTGNSVTSDGYRIAYATADSLLSGKGGIDRNAFTRAENNPIALSTEGEMRGIGHSSTVLGPDMDAYYLAYHILNLPGGPNRSLGIDRLLFNGTQMSVSVNPEGSIRPALPRFYANGADSEKFDVTRTLVLSKAETGTDFTAEFNVAGASSAVFLFGCTDEKNYASVALDLAAGSILLQKTVDGVSTTVATGTLVNKFKAESLHTVRVSLRDGRADVVFDNMTKIDNAEMTVEAGKIGYMGLPAEARIGYTAFSNVAMGMSDQLEAKQALGTIGASQYLFDSTYGEVSPNGRVPVLENYPFAGVKSLTLAKNERASYLVSVKEPLRYGLELVYRAKDGGKTVGVRLSDSTLLSCTLPTAGTDEDYVKAIICESELEAGIRVVRLESLSGEVNFLSFRLVPVSGETPVFEASLAEYMPTGADYKTIWKLKEGGHYAKAGTRQLVYLGDNTITDFTLEVEMMLEGSTGTSSAGILFHAQNYAASASDSYTSIQGYYLSVNNNQIILESLNYADDSISLATLVKDNPFAESDRFIPLKIRVRGNRISVWSGDRLLLDATDAIGFTCGKLGLYTNGSAVVFRNLKISA